MLSGGRGNPGARRAAAEGMACAAQQLVATLLLLGSARSSSLWGGRPQQPTCVDIPRNVSLCHGIGYHRMRLPNLLEHDTMQEVAQQAASWTPLRNVDCHPDTRLFLCSLFSPVCLERAIYPCRSLCDEVRLGCEGIMKKFGFPWPDMFRCDRFPVDNDMCISPQAKGPGNGCQVCSPVETYENILYNYCRADLVLKTKFRRIRKATLSCKKVKVLKGYANFSQELRTNAITIQLSDTCCEKKSLNTKNVYLVMGISTKTKLAPSFIMPWSKEKPFKRAIRMFRKLNCSDPKLVSRSVIGDALLSSGSASTVPSRRKATTVK